jgi:phage regulator Rha-like protein
MTDLISVESITNRIYFIRGMKVMIDRDLADLYGVETKAFKQAVRRNKERFPDDFMFVLTNQEVRNLGSQIVTSSWGGTRYPPMAFTEQGVAMLSSVLNSKRAIDVNIAIMRTFVKMRGILANNKEFAGKLKKMEEQLAEHEEQFLVVFEAIKQMLKEEEKPKRKIGF